MCESKDEIDSSLWIISFIIKILSIFGLVFVCIYKMILFGAPFYCIRNNVLPRYNYVCHELKDPYWEGDVYGLSKFSIMKDNQCPVGTNPINFVDYSTGEVCNCKGVFGYAEHWNQIVSGYCGVTDSIGGCHTQQEKGGRCNLLNPTTLKFCAKQYYYGSGEEIAINSIDSNGRCSHGRKKCAMGPMNYLCVNETIPCPTVLSFKISMKQNGDDYDIDLTKHYKLSNTYYIHFREKDEIIENADEYYTPDISKDGLYLTVYRGVKSKYYDDGQESFSYSTFMNYSTNANSYGECVDFTKRFYNNFEGESFNLETLGDHFAWIGRFMGVFYFIFTAVHIKPCRHMCDFEYNSKEKSYPKGYVWTYYIFIFIGFLSCFYLRFRMSQYGGNINFDSYCSSFVDYEDDYFGIARSFCKVNEIILGAVLIIFTFKLIYFRDDLDFYGIFPCLNLCNRKKKVTSTKTESLSPGGDTDDGECNCCCCVCYCKKKTPTPQSADFAGLSMASL